MANPLAGQPASGRAGTPVMIHPNLIKRKADEDGLSAPVVERDYVLAHALAAICRYDERRPSGNAVGIEGAHGLLTTSSLAQ